MINRETTDWLINAAENTYTDDFPYHNWGHAQNTTREVEILVRRANARGLKLGRHVMMVAASWHDSGLHWYKRDTERYRKALPGHELPYYLSSPEDYSLYLLDSFLPSGTVDSEEFRAMREGILGTKHNAVRDTPSAVALHYADVANIGGPTSEFIDSSVKLWHESNMQPGSEVSWRRHIHLSKPFIEQIIDESRRELPLLGEPVNTKTSFDTQAIRNLASLSDYRFI